MFFEKLKIYLCRKSLFPPFGGPDGQKLNRKLIYSRFRPVSESQ